MHRSRRIALQALNKTTPAEFENILMATHYTCLMRRCREKGGKDCLELASKASITLLRYSDFIPCDKCFYQVRRCERVCGYSWLTRLGQCCSCCKLARVLGMMPPF